MQIGSAIRYTTTPNREEIMGTRFVRFLFITICLVLVASCADEKDITFVPNSYCEAQGLFACDGDRLKICGANGEWAYESCDSVCEGLGQTSTGGCTYDEERGHDFCLCSGSCCEDGEQRCAEDDLEVCQDCDWVPISCSEFCATFATESTGCDRDPISGQDACMCEGMSSGVCDANFVKCEEGYVTICNPEGSWTTVSCREECEKKDRYFGYCEMDGETPMEICHCSQKPEDELCKSTQPTCLGTSLAVCEGGEIETRDCATLCEEQGLSFISCSRDNDRGHDVCVCE